MSVQDQASAALPSLRARARVLAHSPGRKTPERRALARHYARLARIDASLAKTTPRTPQAAALLERLNGERKRAMRAARDMGLRICVPR